ncbi:MAG: DUF5686 family protein [Bacteroidota bacterium]|nr:DUF5686 family protein [Bacteroidota bacterium]
MSVYRKVIYIYLSVFLPINLLAQGSISGSVKDSESGDAVAYATIKAIISGTKTQANFDGSFIIQLNTQLDSLEISASGFITKNIKIIDTGILLIKLSRQTTELKAVVIKPKANKALRILDSVYIHKQYNSPDLLISYQCENFNRIELAVNNLSKSMTNKTLTKKLAVLMDTNKQILNEDGKFVLPVFISESVSDYYCIKKPLKERDIIKAVKITGVGVQDGATISQLTASVFQEYNFYNNWITVVDKQFASPLNPQSKKLYYIKLVDSMDIDGKKCYQISLRKKHSQDLLFTGDIWIEDSTFALKRMVLETDKSANINFVEKIKLQQEFYATTAGPWLPSKTRITIDIDQFQKKAAGVIAKYYTTSSNIIVNSPKPLKFFEDRVTVNEDSHLYQDSFWNNKRQENTADADPRFISMVDSVKEVPVIKRYTDIVDIIANGYFHYKKLDFGHYLYLFNHNYVEGYKVRLGFKTSYKWNRDLQFAGYVAYGFQDQRVKYRVRVDYVFSRKPWIKAGYAHRHDIEGLGLGDVNFSTKNNLFAVVSFFTSLKKFNLATEHLLWLESAPTRGLTTLCYIRTKNFNPQGLYTFGWNDAQNNHYKTFNDFSLTIDNTYSRKDVYIQNNNERINLGSVSPRFNVSYTLGVKDVLPKSFSYHSFSFYIDHKVFLKKLGTAYYKIRGNYILGTIPYLLLDIQKGNQAFVYNSSTFNMMNFVEFVTDKSISAEYEHHFEGLFFSRLPIIKKWNLRFFVNGKTLWGSLRQANWDFLPQANPDNVTITRFQLLNNQPYAEVGYGIENILKVIRIDFLHRLTYLSNPNTRAFGIKLSAQFKF